MTVTDCDIEWDFGKKSNGKKNKLKIMLFFEKTLEQNLGQILSECFFKTHGKNCFSQLTHF